MKILRQGIRPKMMEKFEAECRHCKTLFEFHRVEAQLIIDGRDGNYQQIACPTCGENVRVADK